MLSRVIYMDLSPTDERILEIFSKTSVENMLFFDIETTGLSWKDSMVFLIGILRKEMGTWRLEQWFLDDPSCERGLLERFFAAQDTDTFLVHYNGRQFDLPFLAGRCRALGLTDPWTHDGRDGADQKDLDLYQILRPCRKVLGLDRLRLADLEAFLGHPRDAEISGRECASLYRKYALEKDPAQADRLLAHNRQDLLGMACALGALAYPALFGGHFRLEGCRSDPGDGISAEPVLTCTLRLTFPLPTPFSLDCAPHPWSICGEGGQVRVAFPLENGCLKMYYRDYKDYYYLPDEDTAVHKSVGAYVDRAHRVAATAQTCYTRFPCSLEFMQDGERVEAYVRHCLSLENICSIFDGHFSQDVL